MRNMRLEDHPSLGVVGVMLDWQEYYSSLGTGKEVKELVGKVTHAVIKPKGIMDLCIGRDLPTYGLGADYVHVLVDNWAHKEPEGESGMIIPSFRINSIFKGDYNGEKCLLAKIRYFAVPVSNLCPFDPKSKTILPKQSLALTAPIPIEPNIPIKHEAAISYAAPISEPEKEPRLPETSISYINERSVKIVMGLEEARRISGLDEDTIRKVVFSDHGLSKIVKQGGSKTRVDVVPLINDLIRKGPEYAAGAARLFEEYSRRTKG